MHSRVETDRIPAVPDDLARATPLRLAVASGDPVVLRTGPSWLPAIREAAATCGRLGDLLVVHRAGRSRERVPRAPVRSFRFEAAAIGLPGHRVATRWSATTIRDEEWAHLPTLLEADLGRPSPIVALLVPHRESPGELAVSIARRHLALHAGASHVRYLRLDRYAGTEGVEAHLRGGEAWIRPVTPRERTQVAGSVDAIEAWTSASAIASGRGGIAWEGDALRLDRHGLVVFAHPLRGEAGRGGWRNLAVHVACADGLIESSAYLIRHEPGSSAYGDAMEWLAATVARRDAPPPSDAMPSWGISASEHGEAVDRVLRRDLGRGPRAAAMGRVADVETFLALGSDPAGRAATLRAIRSGPDGGRGRRDLARTWPALSTMLRDPAFAAMADGPGRTVPSLALAMGTTEPVARRASALPWVPLVCNPRSEGDTQARALGRLLSAFPFDALPRPMDRTEGEALALCLDEAAAIVVFSGGAPADVAVADVARLLVRIPARDWGGRHAKLAAAAVDDAGDMVLGLGRWLAGLAGRDWNDRDVEVAFSLLTEHRNLLDLFAAGRRWHEDRRLSEWTGDLPEDCDWPAPFAPIDLGRGWSAAALSSLADLRDEGSTGPDADGALGLGHCVPGYASSALAGQSVIVSLRFAGEGGMQRDSTAELVPDVDGDWRLGDAAFALSQHRGRANAAPSVDAVEALARLRVVLLSGAVPSLAPERAPVPEADPAAVRVDAVAVHDAWRRILPRRLASLTVEDLLSEAAARGEAMDRAKSSPIRDVGVAAPAAGAVAGTETAP